VSWLGSGRLGRHRPSFHSLNAIGPTRSATEGRYPATEERAILQQGEFLRVQRLLKALKISI
jgi:hypothetical protein